MALKEISQGGGGWFKPEDHADDLAIFIEVTGYQAQRPSDFGPKDSIVADMTFFESMEDLHSGTPSRVAEKIRIEKTVLTRDLNDDVGVGNATIVVLGKAKAAPGRQAAWVWRPASKDARALVVQYAEKRDAELAAALDDVPEFE